MRFTVRLLSTCLCLVLTPAFFAQDPVAEKPAAYLGDPRFVSAMLDAKKLTKDRQYPFAEDAYKKASKIAGGKDAACLKALLALQSKVGDNKAAASTAQSLEAIASTPQERSEAQVSHGVALYRQAGEKGKPELLRAARRRL